MESLTIKIEKDFLQEIEKVMKKKHYSTKTEFVREALREKLTKEEKEEIMKALDQVYGSSKKKTSDADLRRGRERVFARIEKEMELE